MTAQKNVVFVSVGTSLLTNFKFNFKTLTDRLSDESMNQDILAMLDNKFITDANNQNRTEDLAEYLVQKFCTGVSRSSQGFAVSEDPLCLNRSASAEIQSVTTFFKEKGWLIDPQEELVYLIATDTDSCEFAAQVIRKVLIDNGYASNITIMRIPKLDIKTDYHDGFESLFHELEKTKSALEKTYRKENLSVYFNFTGGFKGVIPKLQQYANVHGFTIFYQYEHQDNIVEVEPYNLGFLLSNYVLLREDEHYAYTFKNFTKGIKALDKLVEKRYFQLDDIRKVYTRTSEGRLAYQHINQVLPMISTTMGFISEFMIYEMLEREGLTLNGATVPPGKTEHSVKISGREFDIFMNNNVGIPIVIGEVKSFLQILYSDKFKTQLKKQLDNLLKNRPNVKCYTLFIYGLPDTYWDSLKANLLEIEKMVIDKGLWSFHPYCFETSYDPNPSNGNLFMEHIQKKCTTQLQQGKDFVEVKPILLT
ncbi:MAG: hypothetical protein MUF58_13500 [Arcicella sp.]|jgi:putative CRISPR-associated protein (TIGR02619 family)|nr:hypothetical protein [Arcicella sp.]